MCGISGLEILEGSWVRGNKFCGCWFLTEKEESKYKD